MFNQVQTAWNLIFHQKNKPLEIHEKKIHGAFTVSVGRIWLPWIQSMSAYQAKVVYGTASREISESNPSILLMMLMVQKSSDRQLIW